MKEPQIAKRIVHRSAELAVMRINLAAPLRQVVDCALQALLIHSVVIGSAHRTVLAAKIPATLLATLLLSALLLATLLLTALLLTALLLAALLCPG